MRSTVEKADSIGFVVAKVSRNKPSIPIEGKTVMLQKDRTGDTVDRYGRWLRYVLLDGDNFNARLIREGYCRSATSKGRTRNGRLRGGRPTR